MVMNVGSGDPFRDPIPSENPALSSSASPAAPASPAPSPAVSAPVSTTLKLVSVKADEISQTGQLTINITFTENGVESKISKTLNVKVGGDVLRDKKLVENVVATFKETGVLKSMADEFLENKAREA